MKIQWEPAKQQANLRKHRLDFADADVIMAGPTFTFEDTRFAYGEQRYITLGLLRTMIVVIAHTERSEAMRIISMRKATRYEECLFFQSFRE
jgi:uncharacterized DUF497 family protein